MGDFGKIIHDGAEERGSHSSANGGGGGVAVPVASGFFGNGWTSW